VSAPAARPGTLREVCERVWAVEAAYGLPALEVGGVWAWQSLRMNLFYEICEALGIYSRPHAPAERRGEALRRRAAYAWAGVARNPFLAARGADVAVFPHNRVQRVDGGYADIYSRDLVDDLRAQGKRVVVLERPHFGRHRATVERRGVRYLEFLYGLEALFRRLEAAPRMPEATAQQARDAGAALNQALGLDLDLPGRLTAEARAFRARHRGYRLLLEWLRPGEVVLVVGYGQASLIRAAKDLGIPVTEVQHGVIGRYHMGYSHPHPPPNRDYLPDRFLSWGPYWTRDVDFPLPPEAVEVVGFTHFRKARARYADAARDPKRVLVVSQGAIGPALAERMWLNREALEGYDVHYKLHPGEYQRWRDYPALVALSGLPNVTVVKEADLYGLQARSRFQIGVFSTAIYEGLAFGCGTVLCDLPGIEYMEGLIAAYGLPVCRGADLGACLKAVPDAPVPTEDLF
jgi:hypothetical protein